METGPTLYIEVNRQNVVP